MGMIFHIFASTSHLINIHSEVPGPTFRMRKGTEAIVRFVNHGKATTQCQLDPYSNSNQAR